MTSFINKLKQALVKTSNKISSGIDEIFFKKKLDEQSLNALEELLISTDVSSAVAAKLVDQLRSQKFDKEISPEYVKELLAQIITNILSNSHTPLILNNNKLTVILVSGVNGNGKTTTIGKLAATFIAEGRKVAVSACDTFRAAAVEQLEQWAHNVGALFISGPAGSDPASVAYNSMQISIEKEIDILFIDTAGRLHNYKNLMDELAKIIRVIKKADSSAPHHSLLVIDGTTGQNAYNQVEQFKLVAGITGLVVTKLDGTAKAGSLIGIVQKFALPIHFIGIGEKMEDLKPFEAKDFAKTLVGI